METTVMVVGNTGVGKSSLGNRMLGFLPSQRDKPFCVAGTVKAVTEKLEQYEGTWFGETPGSKLVVVDTPGLGDSGMPPERPGPLVDTENMAAAGRYLDENPVNAIVIVLSAINPRVDFTLARLIQIIVGKLHHRDYNKILVAVNAYSHAPYAVNKRVTNSDKGWTEEQHQDFVRNEVLSSFKEWTNIAIAPSFDPVRFKNQIFLLDSVYMKSDASDEKAFVDFRDMCISVGEIHRDYLTQGVLPVHPELQQALDALEESKAAIAKASEEHKEMLERMRAEAAAAQQVSEERHTQDVEAIRVATEDRIQAMKEKGESEQALDAERKRAADAIAAANAAHVKELETVTAKANEDATRMQRETQNSAEMQSLKAIIQNQSDQITSLDRRLNQPQPHPQPVSGCATVQACFPGNAVVTIEGKGLATMQSLAAGEKVLSIDMDGSHIYDTVCFFGHQDPDSWSCFCSLSIQSESGHVHQLLLSPTHFLPIGTDLIANAYKYAKDVHIGDIAWVVIAEDLKAVTARGVVIGKNWMTAQGLYNPFTRNGLIVINDVVASAHSHWLLDDILPTAAKPYLPGIYQAIFKPVFAIAGVVGVPAFSAFLDQYIVPHAHEWPSLPSMGSVFKACRHLLRQSAI
ncbi:hypothetical protein WJX82_001413 [Trebouxia sp. C0006]